jgi:hypothetical protein
MELFIILGVDLKLSNKYSYMIGNCNNNFNPIHRYLDFHYPYLFFL